MLLDLVQSYFLWPARHRRKASRREPPREKLSVHPAFLALREALQNPDREEAFDEALKAFEQFQEEAPPAPHLSHINLERLEDLARAKDDLKALGLLHLLEKHGFRFATLASDSRIVYLLAYKEVDTADLVEDFEDSMLAERGLFLPEALTPSLKENLLPLLATLTDEDSFKVKRYGLLLRSPVSFRPAFSRLHTFQVFDLWGPESRLVCGWTAEFVNATSEAYREWVRRFILGLTSEIVLKRFQEEARKTLLAGKQAKLPENNVFREFVLAKEAFLDKLLIAPEKISLEDWKVLQANEFYRQVWDRLRQASLIDRTGLPIDDIPIFHRKALEMFKGSRVCPMCGRKILSRKSQFVCGNTCRQKLKRLKDKHFLPVFSKLGFLATAEEIATAIRERLRKIKHPWLTIPFDLRAIVERFLDDPSIHQQAA